MAKLRASAAAFRIVTQSTLEATQRILVETAKREHAKVMRADPRPTGFRRSVDGVEGAPEERAKPLGVIRYDYRRLDEVVQFAMETLFDLSPVLSGEYRMAHTLFVNGVVASNLKDWLPGSEIVISNFVLYARKIEMGKMKMRVPGTDQVYGQASVIVDRRFGNVADVGFTYRGVVAGQTAKGGEFYKSAARFPALVIGER